MAPASPCSIRLPSSRFLRSRLAAQRPGPATRTIILGVVLKIKKPEDIQSVLKVEFFLLPYYYKCRTTCVVYI